MSRSKELWQAECEGICEQYMNGVISREVAIKELRWRGWETCYAEAELDAWLDADECDRCGEDIEDGEAEGCEDPDCPYMGDRK